MSQPFTIWNRCISSSEAFSLTSHSNHQGLSGPSWNFSIHAMRRLADLTVQNKALNLHAHRPDRPETVTLARARSLVSNRLNQIVKHPQMRFSGGSAASRRTPTVLTSFLVLVGVIYALNGCTCSAGREGALSGTRSPGQTTLVSLNARAVAPCQGRASGCGHVAKRGLWVHLSLELQTASTGCSSDSAIGCGAARSGAALLQDS